MSQSPHQDQADAIRANPDQAIINSLAALYRTYDPEWWGVAWDAVSARSSAFDARDVVAEYEAEKARNPRHWSQRPEASPEVVDAALTSGFAL